MRANPPLVLLYDGDCRICAAFAKTLALLAGRRVLGVRAIQSSTAMLVGMPRDRVLASAHAVTADGRIRSGPDVLPALASAFLRRPQLEYRMNASARTRSTAEFVYRALVAFRDELSCATGASSSAGRSPR